MGQTEGRHHQQRHITILNEIQVVEEEWHIFRSCRPPCPCQGHRQTETKLFSNGKEISFHDLTGKLLQEISEASQGNQKIQSEIILKNQEVLRLEHDLAQKEAQQRNLENNISNLAQKNEGVKENINMKQEKLVKIQNDNTRLRHNLKILKNETKTNKNEISELKESTNLLSSTIETLGSQIENLKVERADYQEISKSLGRSNEQKRKQIELQNEKNKTMKEMFISNIRPDMDFDVRMFRAEQLAKMQNLQGFSAGPKILKKADVGKTNHTKAEIH